MSQHSFYPHDLLHVALDEETPLFDEGAANALAALAHAPLVVVRRGARREGRVPIGVRGASRSERYAGWLNPLAVRTAYSPQALDWDTSVRDLPAFAALHLITERWRDLELPWGPTGSVAYELASRAQVVTAASDLDLQVRAPEPFSHATARDLLASLHQLPAPADVQVETPRGGFSLAEFARGGPTCLLRTNDGPRLVRCPWRPAELSA